MSSPHSSTSDDPDMSIVQVPSPSASPRGDNSTELNQRTDFTESQFGQVVFHDLQDGSSDVDLVVKFSFSSDLLSPNPDLDRVALYRVPPVDNSNHIAVVNVKKQDDGREHSVTFAKDVLPEASDFYQLQYLRGADSVMGASIPFRLGRGGKAASPLGPELVTEEDEEEFQVVSSVTDRALEQTKARLRTAEKKYSDLLEVSERLTEDLAHKTDALALVQAEHRKLAQENAALPELKRDLAACVEEKVALAAQLEAAKEERKKLEQKVKRMQAEYDELRGQMQRAGDENALVFEDEKQNAAKREAALKEELATKANMLSLAASQTEKALDELKKEQEGKVKEALGWAKSEVDEVKAKLAREQEKNASLKVMMTGVNQRFEQLEETSKHLKRTLEYTLEDKRKLQEEKDGMEDDLARANDARSDTLRRLHELQQRYAGEPDSSFVVGNNGESTQSSLNLESRLRALKDELDKTGGGFERDEEEEEDPERTLSSGRNSNKNLDSMVILRALQPTLGDDSAPDSFNVPANYKPVVQQPLAPSPQIPCSPPTVAQSPPVARQSVMAPQIIGGSPVQNPSPRQLERKELDELERWAMSSRKSSCDPPPIPTPFQGAAVEDEEPQGAVGGAPTGEAAASPSSFTLLDDGTPVPDEPLKCPMCPAEFKCGQVRELEFHVDSHLAKNLKCPVCSALFETDDQSGYETHVESHFSEEDEVQRPSAPVSAPTVSAPGFLGNWELDID